MIHFRGTRFPCKIQVFTFLFGLMELPIIARLDVGLDYPDINVPTSSSGIHPG